MGRWVRFRTEGGRRSTLRAPSDRGLATLAVLSALAIPMALAVLAATAAPLAAQNRGELRVRVLTADSVPVVEAEVRILGLGRVTRTDGAGWAGFADVPAGGYLVEATSEELGRAVERVEVERNATVERTLVIARVFQGRDIVVTAAGDAVRSELVSPSSVLRGDELRRNAEASLGETLADEPGLASSYHGPGSSRPIIRGLSGDRVRILEAGVGTGDASDASPDHAPAVEAMTAERIEIIRGPQTLLYGSSAIGGVVNVVDGRIPRELPVAPLSGTLALKGGTVADQRDGVAMVKGALGRLAYHADILRQESENYNLPDGFLANSDVETTKFAAGLSWVGTAGYVGGAFSGSDSDYGVPGSEEGDVRIDLRQRRGDWEAGWRFGGAFLKGIEFRAGVADYRHFETLPDETTGEREIETTFNNHEWEARLEVRHAVGERLDGAVGVQYRYRDFEAIGEEGFVPPTTTEQFGAFLFERVDLGRFDVEAGLRFERQDTRNDENGLERDFETLSAALGVVLEATDGVTVALNGSRSVKSPSAVELFSDGPHLATLQFEVGDPDLEEEVAYGVDLGVRLHRGRVRGELNFFANSFDDFVFQKFTGETRDGLRFQPWAQADAFFTGFEYRATVDLLRVRDGDVFLEASGDYVRAEFTDTEEALPRIPPLRFGGGLGYRAPRLHGSMKLRRVTEQDRVADFESVTSGYSSLDGEVGYRFFLGGLTYDVALSASNLTDELQRNHSSFLVDVAPLPGREVRLSLQVGF